MPVSSGVFFSEASFEKCESGHTKSTRSRSIWLVFMSTDVVCSKTLRVGLVCLSDGQSIGPNGDESLCPGYFFRS